MKATKRLEITEEEKVKFLRKNKRVMATAMQKSGCHSIEGRSIVNRAREYFGYSPKTNDVDIFSSLQTAWRKNEPF